MITAKSVIMRILLGGIAGILLFTFVGAALNTGMAGGDFLLLGSRDFQWISSRLLTLVGSETPAALIQFGLYFLLGAVIGLGTLPFVDDGAALVVRSVVHYLITAAVLSALIWLCGWSRDDVILWLVDMGLLASAYLVIWLGRWLSLNGELDLIREKLGIMPKPSPLKWRESLPYILIAFFALFVFPAVFSMLLFSRDAFTILDTHVLMTMVVSMYVLPLAAFWPAFFLSRSYGFCPLYPAACAVFYPLAWLVIYLPTFDPYVLVMAFLAAGGGTLFGELCGMAARHIASRRGEDE